MALEARASAALSVVAVVLRLSASFSQHILPHLVYIWLVQTKVNLDTKNPACYELLSLSLRHSCRLNVCGGLESDEEEQSW